MGVLLPGIFCGIFCFIKIIVARVRLGFNKGWLFGAIPGINFELKLQHYLS